MTRPPATASHLQYVILLGPPGAGKGTQGAMLAARLGVPKIATGDLLRAAVRDGTPLGEEAQGYMASGLLVPDEIILGLIGEVLESEEAAQGVIMDGFPRTVAQAEAVAAQLETRNAAVSAVLSMTVPVEELVDRMLGRAATENRADDTPEAIQRRLAVYEEETAPLIAYYRERGTLREVDGTGTIGEIAERIDRALDP